MTTVKPLRVLFLTRYPVDGASSRYRVFQYVPYLEALGVECTVQSFMDASMYRLTLRRGHTVRKVAATLRAIWRRLSTLSQWRNYDVLYLQRELLPFGPPLIERVLKRMGAVILFDYDDALFIKKASRYNPIATFLRSPQKTRQMFRIADCTIAGNNWLRDTAVGEGGKAITLEVAEDTARYPERASESTKNSSSRPITIGWLGSPSTVKYLSLIEVPLRRIAQRYPEVRWEIVGGPGFTMEGVPWQLSEWSLQAEPMALIRFDIGLMPLPMDEWSKGKSGGKARTYMAAGVVPVCSAIGYNLELIREGETGFLCLVESDWFETLSRLIENSDERQRVAAAARRDVERRFAPAKQAGAMHRVFIETLLERGRL